MTLPAEETEQLRALWNELVESQRGLRGDWWEPGTQLILEGSLLELAEGKFGSYSFREPASRKAKNGRGRRKG